MTDQPINHRDEAKLWLTRAERSTHDGDETDANTAALIAIGHALLADPPPTGHLEHTGLG